MRTTGDHPNYSMAEIGQNTKKSPGDLLSQTPVEKPSANSSVKNTQMS